MSSSHRLVVVGGVAGGMSCAARARRLDETADIIVLEAGPVVSFANCGLPYFVSGEIADESSLLLQTPESLRASLNLDVRVNHTVLGIDTAAKTVSVAGPGGTSQISYDSLVLSPGSAPIALGVPGEESPRVRRLHTVEDARAMRDAVEHGVRRAVVIGAGFIGLEAAEALAHRGIEVHIVHRGSHILSPFEPELAWWLEREAERLGIALHPDVRVTEIESGERHDTVRLSHGSPIEADLIVHAIGGHGNVALAEAAGIDTEDNAIVVDAHGRTSAPRVWAVGDAVLKIDATGSRRPVPLAGPANREGRLVADAIFRPESARPLPNVAATAIIRFGELTAAMTGANSARLAELGIAFETLHAHPNQHAGYFPGASAVRLTVHFDPNSGELFGAQAVGTEGVDKRIDVIATAMRGGLKIDDLIDLDLAYAPPYGSAKDPVNLVGYAGQNVLTGHLRLWHARDWVDETADALVLDVRRPDEWNTVRVSDAVLIPHTELRDRLDEVCELAAGRKVRVFCQSGVRSAIAHRILVAAGLDSASLSGGMLTIRASGVPVIVGEGGNP
ncbi:MAG TPA: FAD-dependent oxidoreductase [Microbacteriaceae bacterium]|nr:FAD-dependent oxidoreductase [Microbacteriaceae bacterium]